MKFTKQFKVFLLFVATLTGAKSFGQDVFRKCLPDNNSLDLNSLNTEASDYAGVGAGNWTVKNFTEISSPYWSDVVVDKINSGNWTTIELGRFLGTGNWKASTSTKVGGANWTALVQQDCSSEEWTNEEIEILLNSKLLKATNPNKK